jgi:hypothetical protein
MRRRESGSDDGDDDAIDRVESRVIRVATATEETVCGPDQG